MITHNYIISTELFCITKSNQERTNANAGIYLRAAFSHNDLFLFCSLSLLSTNLSGEQETELRTFMAKRLARGTVYSGNGNINVLENVFPGDSALCYYCLLRGGKESGDSIEQQDMYDIYLKNFYS